MGKEYFYAVIIILGSITFGEVMCYPSPTGIAIRHKHGLSDDAIQWSFYNSVSSLFAIAGPFITAGIRKCFHQSRKITLLITAISSVCFWLLNCLTSVNIWAGIVMRAGIGLVTGMFSSICPMYLVEIAPSSRVDLFGSLNQAGIVFGIVYFDFLGPSLDYMELNYLAAAVSFVQCILIWFLPESPVTVAYEDNQNDDEEKVQTESLWQKKYICHLIAGIATMFFQQFCGNNAFLTNLADIMNEAGLDLDGNYQAGIATLAQFIAVFVGGLMMDKLGAFVVWTISSGGIALFLLIYALQVKYEWSSLLPMICIFFYQFAFGVGMGPMPWFIISLLLPDTVRAQASTIIAVSNWVFAFLVIFIWPQMRKGMGMFGSLIFFLVVAVGSIIFGFFYVHDPDHDKSGGGNEIDENTDSDDHPSAL